MHEQAENLFSSYMDDIHEVMATNLFIKEELEEMELEIGNFVDIYEGVASNLLIEEEPESSNMYNIYENITENLLIKEDSEEMEPRIDSLDTSFEGICTDSEGKESKSSSFEDLGASYSRKVDSYGYEPGSSNLDTSFENMRSNHCIKEESGGKGPGISDIDTILGDRSINYFLKEVSKGNENKSSSDNSYDESSGSTEEFGSSIPKFPLVPRGYLHSYSLIINRDRNESVTMNELDYLQPELELLFSFVFLRTNILNSELANLVYIKKNKIVNKSISPNINQRKRKHSDNILSMSLKDLSKMRGRMIGMDMSCETDTDSSSSDVDMEDFHKYLIPTSHRFWNSVVPNGKEITLDNIKDLNKMIRSCQNAMKPLKTPPLGPHYSLTWAEQDLIQEGVTPKSAEAMLKRGASLCKKKPGSLVQRLASALMEDFFVDSSAESDSDSSKGASKVHATPSFESRFKKKLKAVGLFHCESDDSNEILEEIKKCSAELRTVASQNKVLLELLRTKALRTLERQKVQSRIRDLDNELSEVYKINAAAILKNRHLKKNEKEEAWEIIKKRKELRSILHQS